MKVFNTKCAFLSRRMDNKLVRLESRMDQLIHSIDEMRRHMLTPGQALAGAFTFFIAIVVAVVTIISYGGDRTDAGYGVGSAVESRVSATERFEKLIDDTEEIKRLIKTQSQAGPAPHDVFLETE